MALFKFSFFRTVWSFFNSLLQTIKKYAPDLMLAVIEAKCGLATMSIQDRLNQLQQANTVGM